MNLKNLAWLTAAIACSAAVATAALAQNVKVNGKEIPQSRIDAAVKGRIAQGQPDTPQLRDSVKETLINQEIISQEAVKRGLDKNPEVAARIDISKQDTLVNAYVQDYLRRNPVTEESLRKEYDRIKAQLGSKEYKARHVLVENEEEAKDIIARVKKGASFEKLAVEKSKDPGSKEDGGALDWSVPTSYVKPFGDALAKLKKGQMTDAPVKSEFGWHVIRLDDERALKVPSYEEVKPNLQRGMQQQSLQKAVTELRAKAKIE
jgi:peptidyl-prolyl cis-trans isomerase C